MGWVKICGVRTVEDARLCGDAGADAIGVNFWAGSRRCCAIDVAERIQSKVGAALTVVGVFVDADVETVQAVLARTGIAWAQFHGSEGPDVVRAFQPTAYKALRVSGPHIASEARAFPGERVLLDSAAHRARGGSGEAFDWNLAAPVAAERSVILAGGLNSDNVASAIRCVKPFGVDVASGVEQAPGVKDRDRVMAFVAAARAAWGELGEI